MLNQQALIGKIGKRKPCRAGNIHNFATLGEIGVISQTMLLYLDMQKRV